MVQWLKAQFWSQMAGIRPWHLLDLWEPEFPVL